MVVHLERKIKGMIGARLLKLICGGGQFVSEWPDSMPEFRGPHCTIYCNGGKGTIYLVFKHQLPILNKEQLENCGYISCNPEVLKTLQRL